MIAQGFADGQSIFRPPLFDGEDNPYWKTRMEFFLQGYGYEIRSIIEDGDLQIFKPKEEWTTEEKNKISLNSKAKSFMWCASRFERDGPGGRALLADREAIFACMSAACRALGGMLTSALRRAEQALFGQGEKLSRGSQVVWHLGIVFGVVSLGGRCMERGKHRVVIGLRALRRVPSGVKVNLCSVELMLVLLSFMGRLPMKYVASVTSCHNDLPMRHVAKALQLLNGLVVLC
ncbi:hypothetical protein Taro_024046 [Colocasia esculenta]|uniref:DUF4219 domain-containing protein n=1 Tax=Colocasia esculenta TaxID=4460 RepID=A0A843V871_COLES|nr:hypothetical protein [Colocasia esculenta]